MFILTHIIHYFLLRKHHIVAIIYLSGPIFWPHYRWVMGGCLSVEINTWLMIARRVMYKRKDQIPTFVEDIISYLFFVTWIIIRIFVYPFIMYLFITMWLTLVGETGKLFHWPMLAMPGKKIQESYVCLISHFTSSNTVLLSFLFIPKFISLYVYST